MHKLLVKNQSGEVLGEVTVTDTAIESTGLIEQGLSQLIQHSKGGLPIMTHDPITGEHRRTLIALGHPNFYLALQRHLTELGFVAEIDPQIIKDEVFDIL